MKPYYCENCNKEVPLDKLKSCCNGEQCGCYGMPIGPFTCSDECEKEFEKREKAFRIQQGIDSE